MNSTNVFAELVVLGLQVILWMLLVCLSVFGYPSDVEKVLKSIAELDAVVAMVMLALAYSAGAVWDRVVDRITKRIDAKVRKSITSWDSADLHRNRAKVFSKSEETAKFIDYLRLRMRLLRGTAVSALISGVACAVLCYRQHGFSGKQSLMVSVVGLGVATVVGVAYLGVLRSYYTQLKAAFDATG